MPIIALLPNSSLSTDLNERVSAPSGMEIAASIVACGEEVRKLKAAGDTGAGAKVSLPNWAWPW